jgi:hypothetical protein
LRWEEARAALDAAYRTIAVESGTRPSVELLPALVAVPGAAVDRLTTEAVDRSRSRADEGQRRGQASARDRRAAAVMSAMGRLGDDMDAVAAELGMKKNAVAQIVKHARLRAGATA